MPLTDEEQREEYQRTMDQMAINIETLRSDMVWESRKFLLQAVVSAAALVGAGAALGNYLARREPALLREPWKALSAAFGAGVAVASGLIAATVLTHVMQSGH